MKPIPQKQTNVRPRQNGSVLRWLIGLCCVGGLVALFAQWRLISVLRQDNESLRAEREIPVAPENSHSPSDATAELEQLRKDRNELFQLRNEVRQLREQLALVKTGASTDGKPQPATPSTQVQSSEETIRQLGVSAGAGDSTALTKLAELSAAAQAHFRTNHDPNVFAEFRLAFDALGAEAGKGNAAALRAIWQATRMKELEGFAVQALGIAAGQGNEQALEPLLDPERYLILLSSSVSALKPAADAGNARAIEALAAVATNPKHSALWYLAAQGLEAAAGSGNVRAIDTLTILASAENPMLRKQAILGLENAALKKQPRAEEALRRLGWR